MLHEPVQARTGSRTCRECGAARNKPQQGSQLRLGQLVSQLPEPGNQRGGCAAVGVGGVCLPVLWVQVVLSGNEGVELLRDQAPGGVGNTPCLGGRTRQQRGAGMLLQIQTLGCTCHAAWHLKPCHQP